MKLKYKNIFAFTLAEVLITIGIIGIVAEITIPTLINRVQNQANITAWKKSYSELSQIWMLISQENGGTTDGMFSSTGEQLSDDFGNKFIEKMKYIKKCPALETSTTNGCWHIANKWYHLNGGGINSNNASIFTAILPSGAYLGIGGITTSCQIGSSTNCIYMVVDVNGAKTPNKVGKDIFYAGGYGGGIVRAHTIYRDPSDASDPYNCIETASGNNNGEGCSNLALHCSEIDYTVGKCKS